MRRLVCLLLLIFCCLALPCRAEWKVVQIAGRDYLPMRSIAEFYGLKEVRTTSKEVVAMSGVRSLRALKGSAEFFINNLKFILSYPTVEHGGDLCVSRMDLVKLIEPVMRPSKIKNAPQIDTIVLDAGHGGHDSGATSKYGPEKAFTLDTVLRARALLKAAGFKVVLTRDGDYFVELHERARIANRYENAIFISMHFNHGYENAIFISMHFNHGGQGTGVEAYTLAPRGVPSMMADGPKVSDLVECKGNARDAENMALATAAHAALVVKTRMYDRGLKRARFVVIRDIKIPGVLLEGGFQSSSFDGKMIATPLYRQTLAQAILAAVQNYVRAVGSKEPTPEAPKVETPRKPEPTPEPRKTPSEPEPIDPPKTP